MLEDLEKQSRELREKLSRVEKAIDAEKLRLTEEKYGVHIGSVVVDHKGVEHKVMKIDAHWFPDRPWLEGHPKKKDGIFSKAQRHVYGNWELVDSDKGEN